MPALNIGGIGRRPVCASVNRRRVNLPTAYLTVEGRVWPNPVHRLYEVCLHTRNIRLSYVDVLHNRRHRCDGVPRSLLLHPFDQTNKKALPLEVVETGGGHDCRHVCSLCTWWSQKGNQSYYSNSCQRYIHTDRYTGRSAHDEISGYAITSFMLSAEEKPRLLITRTAARWSRCVDQQLLLWSVKIYSSSSHLLL